MVFVAAYCFSESPNGSTRGVFMFSIESLHQERYGAQYPLTYKFFLPDQVQLITVEKFSENLDEWISLKQKNDNQFFNGKEIFRYDSLKGEVFISAAFNEDSSLLKIGITYQTLDEKITPEFVDITSYYDDRKAVVTATMDDYNPGSQTAESAALKSAMEFQKHKIWLTVGVVTRHSSAINFSRPYVWQQFQSLLNGGYIEPASHSRTHPHFIFDEVNYESEIGGSKEDLINYLEFPSLFTHKNKKYVYTWIAPYGQWNSLTEKSLAESNFLVNRCYLCTSFYLADFNESVGFFSPVKYSAEMGVTSWKSNATNSVIELNGKFDRAYDNGLVYHLVLHPQSVDWMQEYPNLHLDYIARRTDVWYVSLGHLYLYQATKEAINIRF